jgi:hypothetical protein
MKAQGDLHVVVRVVLVEYLSLSTHFSFQSYRARKKVNIWVKTILCSEIKNKFLQNRQLIVVIFLLQNDHSRSNYNQTKGGYRPVEV